MHCFELTGQALPAGLHIRVNMSTGLNEARLCSDSDSGTLLASFI